ncbi:MAG: ACT domain-containing protein [Candidatus Omnitrophota bacterium]
MIKNVSLGREITVTATNKVGILADITKSIAEHGINIEGIAGYVEPDTITARIMLLTDENRRALDILKEKGYDASEEYEIVIVELENKPGALKIVSEKLAAEGIDIQYTYGTTCATACPCRMVFATNNNDKAVVTLKK